MRNKQAADGRAAVRKKLCGDRVSKTITVKPPKVRRRIPIEELVKGMTPGKNRFPEFDTRPVGKEII